jgi:dihydroorotase-like cyclic amidohydrolase
MGDEAEVHVDADGRLLDPNKKWELDHAELLTEVQYFAILQ